MMYVANNGSPLKEPWIDTMSSEVVEDATTSMHYLRQTVKIHETFQKWTFLISYVRYRRQAYHAFDFVVIFGSFAPHNVEYSCTLTETDVIQFGMAGFIQDIIYQRWHIVVSDLVPTVTEMHIVHTCNVVLRSVLESSLNDLKFQNSLSSTE